MSAAAIDRWHAFVKAHAAMKGITVQVLELGFEIRRGAWSKALVSRAELAAALRLAGCAIPDPPMDQPPEALWAT